MYESYAWPGAYSFRKEINTIVKWFKDHTGDLLKKIDNIEKCVPVGK